MSSRSLGTGVAQESVNDLYAADAGLEYGIWRLLNVPSFRNQADLNPGTAQNLAFPGSLNGITPTISITALPIGSWYIRQSAPANIQNGGSLAYAGGDHVYALQGNSKTFGYYSISGDSGFLGKYPGNVKQGDFLFTVEEIFCMPCAEINPRNSGATISTQIPGTPGRTHRQSL